jgi:hypothetical protein
MFYFKIKCATCVDKWMKRKIGNIKENFQSFISLSALILHFWWTSSYYYHYYYSLSPLCRVSTLTYLKETTFLGYTVLQLFCSYIFCTFTLRLSEVCVQCPLWLFSVVPWFHAFLLCWSDISWMIMRWFQLPLLLLHHICVSITRALYLYCKALHIF